MLEVKIVGFNIDESLIDSIDATPETITAAFARISRSNKSISELRHEAINNISEARRSNTDIVYGYGHGSIAEHAVFNFEITSISRLACEFIEQHRLCSYMEKSQRYTKVDKDFIIPDEILERDLGKRFTSLLSFQHKAYESIYKELLDYHANSEKLSSYDENSIKRISRNLAKEDARYVTSLANTTQLAITLNARNLELMINRLLNSNLAETKYIGRQLLVLSNKIAPSLIRKNCRNRVTTYDYKPNRSYDLLNKISTEDAVLRGYTINGEFLIARSILDKDISFTYKELEELYSDFFSKLSVHESLPRDFELSSYLFELNISASCFAQLKRHRMCTIISRDYDPNYGCTLPDAIKIVNCEHIFEKVFYLTTKFYYSILSIGDAANYALTQAHKRRVLVSMNARELYHFSRLRMDEHAQWDIRNIATQMVGLAREQHPNLFLKACGKSEFF